MTNGNGIPALLTATAGALLPAACGGGSGGDEPPAGQSGDAKKLAFVACLRKAGVDVHVAGGGAEAQAHVPAGISPESAINRKSPAFQRAQNACGSLLPRKRRGPGMETCGAGPAGGVKR